MDQYLLNECVLLFKIVLVIFIYLLTGTEFLRCICYLERRYTSLHVCQFMAAMFIGAGLAMGIRSIWKGDKK